MGVDVAARGRPGLLQALKEAAGRLRRSPSSETVADLAMQAEDRYYDKKHGLDTGGIVEPTETTVLGDPTEAFQYAATGVRSTKWWLRALRIDPRDFTLVDMGSGKGRVLLLAAASGFAAAIGVEFAPELHEAAIANVAAFAGSQSTGGTITPTLGDAGAFEFPSGPLVVSFINPFTEKVMGPVIQNLTKAYESEPRPIVVVYLQNAGGKMIHKQRNVELLRQIPFLSCRELELPRGPERFLLRLFSVHVFESPEVASAPGRAG